MLEEKTVIASITIDANAVLIVKTATRILKDGAFISETSCDKTLVPGSDVSAEDSRVQAVAAVVWTEDVVAAFCSNADRGVFTNG
jgi:hypothetical protein